jgi:hypothetical protein
MTIRPESLMRAILKVCLATEQHEPSFLTEAGQLHRGTPENKVVFVSINSVAMIAA